MTFDLLHNKIIKETLTESFEKSVNDNLVPKLHALYGTSLEGVQFYEDYVNDNFVKDGYWYYPLTVLIGGIHAVVWIKWDISVSADFKNENPYAYVGNGGIDFIFADDVPIAFKKALEGRSNYFEGGFVKMNVTTDAPNPEMLSGKYSQTFVDEMNRQISVAISRACGIKGLAESSIELDIVFAPNTYMEHTSENVTYRRLLISAKGCSARDFWIKWTRKNSSVAYSVNDNVESDDIVFELGEDVSQKIREKEYRFLVYGNADKYRAAMGRKNVTEWRELIKRAVKRGELTKTMDELEESSHVSEVSDKLSEILEKCGVSVPVSTSADIRVDAEIANEALRLAVLGNGDGELENYVPDVPAAIEEIKEDDGALEIGDSSEDDLDNVECTTTSEEDISSENEIKPESSETSVFDNMPDDEFGEFGLEKMNDKFYLPKEPENELVFDELTFEDILEEFIPKSETVDEVKESTVGENIDISDIDESESVRLDISKTDDDVVSESTEEIEDAEEDTAGDVEIEIYEYTEPEETVEVAEAEEPEAASVEESLRPVSYDEVGEIKRSITEAAEERAAIDNARITRLENEVESLKLQLEAQKKENGELAYKLDEALYEKESLASRLEAEREGIAYLEAQLESEREDRIKAEAKLKAVTVAKETAEGQVNLELIAAQDLRAQNEKQKFAIEQVKRLAEEESTARKNAESELMALRVQIEALKSDNEQLKEIARVAEETCRNAVQISKQHERELLNQIELTEKERNREKELFAEAARLAKEENEQRFAEMREAEIARIAEEARIEALRRVEESKLSDTVEVKLASESQYSAIDTEQIRKKELEDRAKEARMRMEERARMRANALTEGVDQYGESISSDTFETASTSDVAESVVNVSDPTAELVDVSASDVEQKSAPVVNYTYTSYIVRLMFRRNADPNVTARIHEMISYALTEFGKNNIYMKVKASMPDACTVVLNFVKFPEQEFDLLVKLINYLGKSDLGVYKVVLD